MIAQIVNVLVGLWLMAAPAVLGYGGAARANDLIVGPIAATFAWVAINQATRPCRWVVVALRAWMLVASFVLGAGGAARWNGLLSGAAMLGLGLVRGRVSARMGGGWRAVVPHRARSRS